MNSIARPRSCWSDLQQLQHLGLHHHVERGGGLVGDHELGLQARAIAIMTRCFCPPDSSCG